MHVKRPGNACTGTGHRFPCVKEVEGGRLMSFLPMHFRSCWSTFKLLLTLLLNLLLTSLLYTLVPVLPKQAHQFFCKRSTRRSGNWHNRRGMAWSLFIQHRSLTQLRAWINLKILKISRGFHFLLVSLLKYRRHVLTAFRIGWKTRRTDWKSTTMLSLQLLPSSTNRIGARGFCAAGTTVRVYYFWASCSIVCRTLNLATRRLTRPWGDAQLTARLL